MSRSRRCPADTGSPFVFLASPPPGGLAVNLYALPMLQFRHPGRPLAAFGRSRTVPAA
jgi:hypothetical protein